MELSPELSKELSKNARALYSPFSDSVSAVRQVKNIVNQITQALDELEKTLPAKESQQLLDKYKQLTSANQQIINSMLDTMLQAQNNINSE